MLQNILVSAEDHAKYHQELRQAIFVELKKILLATLLLR
jgi:hypothetical protein